MGLIPSRSGGEKSELGHPVAGFRREIDRLFDDFFGGGPLPSCMESVFVPRLNVSETETGLTVTAELPGLEETDVEVSVAQSRLIISGEKRIEKEEKGKAFHVVERSYGKFSRAVDLGGAFDEDKAAASFKNGVLTVNIPRSEKARPSNIHIQSS